MIDYDCVEAILVHSKCFLAFSIITIICSTGFVIHNAIYPELENSN